VEIRRLGPSDGAALLADGHGVAYVASDGETVVGFA
jgi:hypothetical protein